MHLGLTVTDEGLLAPARYLYLLQLNSKLLMLGLELIAELLFEHFFCSSSGRAPAVRGILVILLFLNPFEVSNMDLQIFVLVEGLCLPFSSSSMLVRKDWLRCCVLCVSEARNGRMGQSSIIVVKSLSDDGALLIELFRNIK